MIDSLSEQLINDLLSQSESKSGLHRFSLIRSLAKSSGVYQTYEFELEFRVRVKFSSSSQNSDFLFFISNLLLLSSLLLLRIIVAFSGF